MPWERGPALDLRLRLETTLFVPPSSVKRNVNLPFALHVRRQAHTHTRALAHVAQHVQWQRQKTEGCRIAAILPWRLPKNVCYTLCRNSTLSVLISLSISVSVSVIPPLFRVLGFYGICVTHPSTLECVNSGTFYGILMLNMTAILFLFYLPTRPCLCVCVCLRLTVWLRIGLRLLPPR